MKIFLSALENGAGPKNSKKSLAEYIVENKIAMKYNLMSYFYIQKNKKKVEIANYIKNNSELILIDSGAHSFQKGKKVNWDKYTDEYCQFIMEFDEEKVLGYFEMDIDNIVGYEKVLELRHKLEKVSEKIIPVWHKNRGIDDFKKMCQTYEGKIIAITGFKNEDIQDRQYLMFLKYAKKYNCLVHCLGMTRKNILDNIPFDFTDSSSWTQSSIFGKIDGKGKVTREFSKTKREVVFLENYKSGLQMQKKYEKKWGNN